MKTAKYWVDKLELQKHPEGGWFKEVYRSDEIIPQLSLDEPFTGDRNVSTSIYYLLECDDFSAFHRIKSDELWHFYTGTSAIEILWIKEGELMKSKVGSNFEEGERFQEVIPKDTWFAARLRNKTGFALLGCTVAPGFHFNDFELADGSLADEFPRLKTDILELINT